MIPAPRAEGPIRILELTSADGSGGGPDKTILRGSALTDPEQFEITVCYVRHFQDDAFDIDDRARRLGLRFVGIDQRRWLDRAVWRSVRQVVQDQNIDIVHSHGYKADLLALMLSRTEGVSALSTVHGFTGNSWRERLLYYPVDRCLLKRFPRVITVSNDLRSSLLRAGARPDRVRTILNGIEHQKFRRCPERVQEYRAALELSPRDVVIGSVGRVELQKRFDVLLDAFATLLPRHPELRLLIAGEGSLRTKLESRAEQLGVASACRFLGHRPDTDRIYQAVDVFVQSSDYEGTPNVVLEAMAFEVPIVATDVGGTTDLIDHRIHGLVVPRRDPERLAQAIAQVVQHQPEAQRRVAAARARVEGELSFGTRMRAVESIYEELMTERRRQTRNGDLRN